MPHRKFRFWVTLMVVIGLPLVQSLILLVGAWTNVDLLNQFSLDGTNRDSWEDLMFTLVLAGIGQGLIALFLGAATAFAFTRTPRFRRPALLGISVPGVLLCGWA